jgi:radical SAM protein with 4Fe4S-binding SPASM domain
MPDAAPRDKNTYKQSLKTLKKLFKNAEVNHVTFTGGEPMMSERFAELVLYARMKKKEVTIITNGNYASKKDYKQLMDLGVALFEIPIHSPTAEAHDYMTAVNGSWLKAVQSAKDILEMGAYVVPVIVVTKANYLLMNETLKFISDMGMKQIMINRFNIGGKGITETQNLMVPKDELQKAYKIANEASDKYGLSLTSNVCSPFCLLNPKDYPNIGFGSCSINALNLPVTLDIKGNIRLCNHSPVVAGNIYEKKLEDIFNSHYVKNWIHEKPDFCINCEIYNECLGGCRAASEQLFKTNSIVDPVMLER